MTGKDPMDRAERNAKLAFIFAAIAAACWIIVLVLELAQA